MYVRIVYYIVRVRIFYYNKVEIIGNALQTDFSKETRVSKLWASKKEINVDVSK